MKRIFCTLLITALLFSLCACSADTTSSAESVEASSNVSIEPSSKETSSADPIVSKEESVAVSSKEESVADTSSEVKTSGSITITLDNWDEYFEFVVEEEWQENAFGEAEGLHFVYKFQPKEEYADKIKKNANFSIAVEYTFTTTTSLAYVPITVDYENRTYSLGDIPSETMTGKRTFKYRGLAEYVGELGRALEGNTLYGYCWDFDVTRVEGTIYLK